MVDTKLLRELHAKATSGAWRVSKRWPWGNLIEGPIGERLYDGDDGYRPLATFQACTGSRLRVEQEENGAANGELIVAARNDLIALCDAYDALQRLRAPRKGIYIASRASIPERGQTWRRLRDGGVPIISSWIDEDGPGQTADFGELWERIAREVSSARALVLYAEAGDLPLKGALVEVGIALGHGTPVIVVAPGVELEPRSLRPLGSWAKHPLVTFAPSVGEAISAALGEKP